jgi:MFS family permease
MNQTRDVLPTGSAAPPRLAHWLALSLLGTSFLMVVLDQTIVYVALPSIQRELGLAVPHLQSVMTWFLLSFGAALLTVSGRIASALGPRRMFTLGLSLFTVASLSRGVQGAGAGFLIGGPIADGPGWRWIFLSTVPIGLALTALALIVLPGNETATTGRRLDLPAVYLASWPHSYCLPDPDRAVGAVKCRDAITVKPVRSRDLSKSSGSDGRFSSSATRSSGSAASTRSSTAWACHAMC